MCLKFDVPKILGDQEPAKTAIDPNNENDHLNWRS